MQKWEYFTILQQRGINAGKPPEYTPVIQLNELGDEGWELVSVVAQSGAHGSWAGTTTDLVWVFKRPVAR